jgi:hypothetical protein
VESGAAFDLVEESHELVPVGSHGAERAGGRGPRAGSAPVRPGYRAAETRNVEAVFGAGAPRKWGFDLVGQDLRLVQERTDASRDRLMKAAAFDLDVLVQGFGQAKHHF